LRCDGFEVDGGCAAGKTRQTVVVNPPTVGEKFKRDEERISCKSREGGVRRVAVAGWAQRQNLPKSLLRGSQKVCKSVRGGAEIADAS
jgi:hypothetical protein